MKIVVMDGHTLNPGDLSWEGLRRLGETDIHDRTPPAEVLNRAAGAEIILTNKVVLTGSTLEELPKLRYVGVLATGYNVVDTGAAKRLAIVVTNVPAYGTASVTQMVFAHLLNLTLRAADHARSVRSGKWSGCADFCYWEHPLTEISGLTMGLVGFGKIGQATARVALSFGMKVIYHDDSEPARLHPELRRVSLDDLFRESDVVSLHCPLTEANREMVNAERLRSMRPGAFLINTARGALVDEVALAEALESGRLAGAALDVLGQEPPRADNPLLRAPNCFITPHIAWATRAARQRLMDVAVANIRAFIEGRPINVV